MPSGPYCWECGCIELWCTCDYPDQREMMEAANATIFHDRPDLQYKFDGSAPPLIPALAVIEARSAETRSKARPVGRERDKLQTQSQHPKGNN